MDLIKTFEKLCNYSNVSGTHVTNNFTNLLKKIINFSNYKIDNEYKNILIYKKQGKKVNFNKKIMIFAGYDECGFVIKEIDNSGFIKLSKVGNTNLNVLPGQELLIHGQKKIIGIAGAKPPHLISQEEYEKPILLDSLLIDTGYKVDEIKNIVKIGDTVTFKEGYTKLLNNRYSGKGITQRSNLISIIECMSATNNLNLENDIYFVFSPNYEIMPTSIYYALDYIMPDESIFLDGFNDKEGTKIGNGACLNINPVVSKEINNKITHLASENNVEIQTLVKQYNKISPSHLAQTYKSGFNSATIEIPVLNRYTNHEIVQWEDILSLSKILQLFTAH